VTVSGKTQAKEHSYGVLFTADYQMQASFFFSKSSVVHFYGRSAGKQLTAYLVFFFDEA
jgi:hypothetical protein